MNNPQLWGMYLLCKEELLNSNDGYNTKELTLFHETSPSNATSIAKNNINWRFTSRSRFGIGACFTPNPGYALRYSSSNGGKKIKFYNIK